jgi:hypothetical protein
MEREAQGEVTGRCAQNRLARAVSYAGDFPLLCPLNLSLSQCPTALTIAVSTKVGREGLKLNPSAVSRNRGFGHRRVDGATGRGARPAVEIVRQSPCASWPAGGKAAAVGRPSIEFVLRKRCFVVVGRVPAESLRQTSVHREWSATECTTRADFSIAKYPSASNKTDG